MRSDIALAKGASDGCTVELSRRQEQTLMEGAKFGLKNAVLFIQSGAVDGFDTVCAETTVGSANIGNARTPAVKPDNRLICICQVLPFPYTSASDNVVASCSLILIQGGPRIDQPADRRPKQS